MSGETVCARVRRTLPAKSLIRNTARKLLRSLQLRRDHVRFSGSILPPAGMRRCPDLLDDACYLSSAEWQARRLRDQFRCRPETRVLDVGCGPGRLATGIIRVFGRMDYTGNDVDRDAILWCKKHIEARHPTFKFHLLPVRNERYNPRGLDLTPGFQFDLPSGAFDLIYVYSVFTNMAERDMRIYLTDFRRLLADDGQVFFTAYAEDGVPPVTINPDGYISRPCSGPLHAVRYERAHLLSLLEELGYGVEQFDHRIEVNGQSAICLTRSRLNLRSRCARVGHGDAVVPAAAFAARPETVRTSDGRLSRSSKHPRSPADTRSRPR
jgi:SAM-dependent methyltransferase